MSVTTQSSFESGHTDQIHDCQYDYYGRVRALPRSPCMARPGERGFTQIMPHCASLFISLHPSCMEGQVVLGLPLDCVNLWLRLTGGARAGALVDSRNVERIFLCESRQLCARRRGVSHNILSYLFAFASQRVATCSSDRTIKVGRGGVRA